MRSLRAVPARSGALVAAVAAMAVASVASAWDLTEVANEHGLGTSSARFDPSGMPAIAFGSNLLMYATFDGTAWSFQVVEGGCGGDRGSSLAFDRAGNPAISYRDDASALRLARHDGTMWVFETVDTTVVIDGATALAFDPAGNPAIAYHDQSNGDLRYASFNGAIWTVLPLDGSAAQVGEYPALAFDGRGNPAISYYDSDAGDLKLARFDGVAWQLRVVDGALDDGRWSSLAFDGAGNPGISYVEDSGTGVEFKYAHWNGTSWDLEYVAAADFAAGTSFAYEPGGNAVMAFCEGRSGFNSHIRYATRDTGTGWRVLRPDPQWDAGFLPSLTFDPQGNPAISYLDGEHGTLKLARSNGTSFRSEHVAGDGPRSDGASIALDAAGNGAVSYWGGTLEGLMLGRFDGISWTTESVDRGMWRGTASSLAFDSNGNPVIAYDDRYEGRLKLARWSGASWTIESVAGPFSDPTAPVAPALALDAANNPAICYRENAFSVRVARWTGSSWVISTLGASDITFEASRSIAFDAAGNPAVVFYDPSAAPPLRYGHWNGASWDVEAIPAGSGGASLVFDGSGEAVVAFGGVSVARRAGGTWPVQVVASGAVGTIASDAAGNPAVNYGDAARTEVKLARWDGSQWLHETVVPSTGTFNSPGPLAIAAAGTMATLYASAPSCRAPKVALSSAAPAALHRGVVTAFPSGWQTLALPLTASNDDETAPFPAPVAPPGTFTDTAPAPAPLVLYRVLRSGTLTTGNSLRLAKGGAGSSVWLEF